jgi:hypothetical protein
MRRVEFEDLIVGNIYYDVDNVNIIPAKLMLVTKTSDWCYFIGLNQVNCYEKDENGLYKFSRLHFYTQSFKFGR